jgi:cytochrome c biogenesis protein CcmG/thiol:disulfide interchange protein DsbE
VAELRSISTRVRVLAVIGTFVVLATVAWILSANPGASGSSDGKTIGIGTPVALDRAAPSFDQPVLDGRGSLSSGRYGGRVLVLNFWASTCRACRTEVPELERLWRSYRARGVGFVGVDYVDDKGAALGFARSFGMTYPSVQDPNGKVGDAYGIFGLPTTYIIGADKRIRFAVYGKIQLASFRRALQSVLAEG